MELIEISVTNFRGIQGPAHVSLRPGLNVIHGPNEIGKSTVLEAAWACLTQRATVGGRTHESMIPRQGGVPEVRVRFSHEGETFDLRKIFNKGKGSTLLRVEGAQTEELREADADERLRAVMGVGQASNRGKIERLGLWPIVWVKQGMGGSAPTSDVDDSGRDGIDGRLAEVGGEVFAGQGAGKVFEAVEKERARYFTPTGQPTKELKDAVSKDAESRDQHAALLGALESHVNSLEEHTRLEASLSKIDEQLPGLKKAEREAQAAQAELEEFGRRSEAAASVAQIAALKAAGARAVYVSREALVEQLEERTKTLATARAQLEAVGGQLDELRARRHALAEVSEAAQKEREEVSQQVQRLEVERRARELRQSDLRLAADLSEAEKHEKRKLEVQAKIAANTVTQKRLKALRALAADRHTALARLEAASAHIELRADAVLDGEFGAASFRLDVGASREEIVSEATELRIDGVATLLIRPGGENLADRRSAAADAEEGFCVALKEVGLPDLVAVEGAAEERRGLEAEAATLEALLQQLDAEGLATRLAQTRVELQRAEEEIKALGLPKTPLPETPEGLVRALEEARGLADSLLASETDAVEILRLHDSRVAVLEESQRLASERLDEAATSCDASRARLERDRVAQGKDVDVEALAVAQESEAEKKLKSAAVLEAELERRNPEQIQRDMERTSRLVASTGEERVNKLRRKTLIEGELSAQQVLGLHDRVAAAEAAAVEAAAALRSVQRRADAAELLFETLKECRAEAQGRYMKPLLDELEKLVGLVFPEGRVQLDESLKELQFDRGVLRGQHDFGELSGGAKEQVGVLVRLALARLMAGPSGLPVLLDDALVATDEGRFRAMQRALDAAATDLQVVFVTCHWDRLRGLGLSPAHRVDMEEVMGAV